MKIWIILSNKDKSKMFMHCSLLLSGMFLICFLVYIFVLANRLAKIPEDPITREAFVRRDFEIYTKKFGKEYGQEELKKRLQNFKISLNEIEYLNRPYLDGSRFGLNKFSDMSPEEFASAMLMENVQPQCKEREKTCFDHHQSQTHENYDKNHTYKYKEDEIPLNFDWRDHDVVGPVLNQKHYCHNCWAFTIIGIMESMLLISKKTTAYSRLSVQELTDCSTYTYKCNYSSLVLAVKFICDKKWPIVSESDYPLTLQRQNCLIRQPPKGALIKRFQVQCDIGPKEIAYIIANHGPVAATVNSRPWRNYLGGVIQYHCSGIWDHTNHAVQIVGYDMSAPTPYFIIRNSWGTDFGDHGYVYIAMDNFLCGVGRQITFFEASLI